MIPPVASSWVLPAAAERVGDVRPGEPGRGRRPDRDREVEAPADHGRGAGAEGPARVRRDAAAVGVAGAERREGRGQGDRQEQQPRPGQQRGRAGRLRRPAPGSEITPVPSTAPMVRAAPCGTSSRPPTPRPAGRRGWWGVPARSWPKSGRAQWPCRTANWGRSCRPIGCAGFTGAGETGRSARISARRQFHRLAVKHAATAAAQARSEIFSISAVVEMAGVRGR